MLNMSLWGSESTMTVNEDVSSKIFMDLHLTKPYDSPPKQPFFFMFKSRIQCLNKPLEHTYNQLCFGLDC